MFVFEGDGVVRDFQGSYTEYLEYRQDLAQQQAQSKKGQAVSQKGGTAVVADAVVVNQSKAGVSDGSKNTLSQTEKKELNKIEKEMSKLAQKIKELEDKIGKSSGSEGYSVLADWSKELNALKSDLNDKEERWIDLVEKK